MSKSISYHPYLISRLKEPQYSALYIEAFFAEKNPEPELLQEVLSNVAEALGETHMTSEQAKIYREQLSNLLSQHGSDAISNLDCWLNALGLKLTVTVCEIEEYSSADSARELSEQL